MKQTLYTEKGDFTQVSNLPLNDTGLSLKSKGLYAYMYSKPDGWDFESRRISKDSTDGKASVNSGLRELENAGYLLREKQRDGRMNYYLRYNLKKSWEDIKKDKINLNKASSHKSVSGYNKPNPEKATVQKSHSGKIGYISNTNYLVTKSISNKNSSEFLEQAPEVVKNISPKGRNPSDVTHDEIVAFMELFSGLNENYEQLFKNKTQREASQRMIAKYGFEKIASAVAYAIEIRGGPYAPSIGTPLQLEQNLYKLKNYIDREQAKLKEKGSNLATI